MVHPPLCRYSYFEKDSDGEEEAEGGKDAEQERQEEFVRQQERDLLLQKRPREEEEGDLMSLAKKRPAKTNGKAAGGITLSIGNRS